ncbi:MAG: hypothetical protein EPN26_08815 [Rhodospirillales bacterium]|nr:MAG: hypothetical protein EPN26_08815 [Rhodospirillales bacterium]
MGLRLLVKTRGGEGCRRSPERRARSGLGRVNLVERRTGEADVGLGEAVKHGVCRVDGTSRRRASHVVGHVLVRRGSERERILTILTIYYDFINYRLCHVQAVRGFEARRSNIGGNIRWVETNIPDNIDPLAGNIYGNICRIFDNITDNI